MASIFSRIIAGQIPGAFAFRAEHWVGLLDLHPVCPGHLLLIPVHEAARWHELPAATLDSYGTVQARASRMLYRELGCAALSILLRDGPAAGQEVPHVHVHLIPRREGDAPHAFAGGSYGVGDAGTVAMAAMGERLRRTWSAIG